MYKETIICIIVVALILIGNTLTGNYTKETIETTSENLIELRNEINQEAVNFENIKKKVSDINIEWEERYKTLAYYIEHNEISRSN